MDLRQYEIAKKAVRALGDDYEVRNIVTEIEYLQIREEYYHELESRPGESEQIRRELAEKFNVSDGTIQHLIYSRYE